MKIYPFRDVKGAGWMSQLAAGRSSWGWQLAHSIHGNFLDALASLAFCTGVNERNVKNSFISLWTPIECVWTIQCYILSSIH